MNGRADEELQPAAAPIGAGPWKRELDAESSLDTPGSDDTKLWTLLRATVNLHSLHRAEDVASQVLDVVLGCLDADNVVVCRREPGISFQVLAHVGADQECVAIALDESRRLAQNEATAGGVQREELATRPGATRDRTSVCIPIQHRSRITGTVYAARSPQGRAFEPRHVEFLRLLAAHAGIALESSRLREPAAAPYAGQQPAAAMLAARDHAASVAAASVLDLVRPLREIERDAILAALREHSGNRTAAAAALDISVRKLQYRIKEYQLQGFAVR